MHQPDRHTYRPTPARPWLALAACAAILLGCDSKAPPTPPPPTPPAAQAKPVIAVIPKGTTHDFWKSVRTGAERAGQEFGATVTFRGPEREDDREQQVALVQNTLSAKPSAIVLAPLDHQALVAPVRQAHDAKVPVVIIDSALDGKASTDFATLVATDNEAGGRLAGAALARRIGGKGRVLILRYLEGSASTTQREEGCIAALRESAGIEVVDPKRYAGATRASAQEAAENLLASQTNIDAVFCPNEPSTFGMLLALRARGLAGKVAFVGFDASDAAVEALRSGQVHALVLQNPIRMGYLGVKTALDVLQGRPVAPFVDTGVMLVTLDNLDKPEAKELWAPGGGRP